MQIPKTWQIGGKFVSLYVVEEEDREPQQESLKNRFPAREIRDGEDIKKRPEMECCFDQGRGGQDDGANIELND